MYYNDKIESLKKVIEHEITPLIDNDYVLWGLPYYANIGDILIWQGELDFLKKIPYKCLGTCAMSDFETIPLKEDTIILITGGGFVGDVWRKEMLEVIDTIVKYPNNRVVFLPNTIYYEDENNLIEDANRLKGINDLIICVRDKCSYETARRFFNAQCLLLPDMAFCIDLKRIEKWCKITQNKKLLLARNDKETPEGLDYVCKGFERKDWPTLENPGIPQRIILRIMDLFKYRWEIHSPWLRHIRRFIYRPLMYHYFRRLMVSEGVKFVSSYKTIYSSRLHVMILAVLLGKEVTYIDNSYGKLGNFVSTWLSDLDIVNKYR